MQSVERAAREAISPLERLEVALHQWVRFVIMPLIAFANVGVPIEAGAFTASVAMAVVVGRWEARWHRPVQLARRAHGLATLPEGISWAILAADGVLADIGFTMALFIAGLALSERLFLAAKIGILTGSALCAVLGLARLVWLLRGPHSMVQQPRNHTTRRTCRPVYRLVRCRSASAAHW